MVSAVGPTAYNTRDHLQRGRDLRSLPGAVVAGDFAYAYTGSSDRICRGRHRRVRYATSADPDRGDERLRTRGRCLASSTLEPDGDQHSCPFAHERGVRHRRSADALCGNPDTLGCRVDDAGHHGGSRQHDVGDDYPYLHRGRHHVLRHCSTVGVRVQQRWQPRLPVHLRHCCRQRGTRVVHDRGIRWHGSDSGPAGRFGHAHRAPLPAAASRCVPSSHVPATTARSSRQRRRSRRGRRQPR